MKKNMGTADRTVRLLIAAVFVVLFLTHVVAGTLAYVLLAVAAIFLLTSMVSQCPLYSVFGISTCKTKPGSATAEIIGRLPNATGNPHFCTRSMPDANEHIVDWVKLYTGDLPAFALSKVDRREIAEDLVQDCFLSACRSLGKFL